jgi:hypothetical protein
MRNILQEAAIDNTLHIKHILATLLRSLSDYLKIFHYHGNINPQTMTAILNPENQNNRDNNSENKKVKIKF